VLLGAGLAQRSSRGTVIDTFRDRIMFPIHDVDGHVAGFIGRDLSGAPAAPKYLNTRQSALFEKGSLLYGLHEGRTLNQSPGQPVVVEGPLDVLAIAAGNTDLLPVAACGTAFTISHAHLVAHAAPEHRVVVAMDGDTAGRSAATTAGEILRHAGLDVRIAVLPNGIDPADHLAHGGRPDTFGYTNALPLLTVYVERTIAAQGDHMQWVEGRLHAARAIASYLSTYPVSHAAAQIGWISQALDIAPATLTLEVATAYRLAPSPTALPAFTSPSVRLGGPPSAIAR